MTELPAPGTCPSSAARPRLAAGIYRRDLIAATGALLVTSGAGATEPPAQAFLFDHKWTFESAADTAGEDFTNRFGLVYFGRLSSLPPPQLDRGGEPQAGWQTSPDLAALARTSQVLFLTGLDVDRASTREAITSCANGLVLNLSSAQGTAVADFIRAYVQQGVAFDLEDARAALAGLTLCRVAVSVAAGEKSATTTALAATRKARHEGQASSVKGQLLLLTFGSPARCLRRSKEAFNACRAGLPAAANSILAVGIDARLPPDTVRATVFINHS